MFEGICCVVHRKGETEPLLFIYKHNITSQKITNAHIDALSAQGLNPVVFTHALEHPGIADGCPNCASAIDEAYRMSVERVSHGPKIPTGEASQGSVANSPPMEEPTETDSPPSRTTLADHFRALPRGSSTPTNAG